MWPWRKTKPNNMGAKDAAKLVKSIPHWHHRFEIAPGVITPGTYAPQFLHEMLKLPPSLKGMSALDIGASDGFFSKELHASGAAVSAVDYRPREGHGFAVMEQILGHRFDYHQANVYDLDPEKIGQFDIVLFLGVLYHLPDMMSALRKVRALCRGTLFIETAVDAQGGDTPSARYWVGTSLANDITNFWTPNPACVRAMLKDLGLDIRRENLWGDRMLVEVAASPDRAATWKTDIAYSHPR